jgi:hypothetical protein
MKLKILRELWHQKEAKKEPKLELLMEVDKEFLDIYQSETGDYGDMPNQKEFDEWLNTLIEEALEGEDWRHS